MRFGVFLSFVMNAVIAQYGIFTPELITTSDVMFHSEPVKFVLNACPNGMVRAYLKTGPLMKADKCVLEFNPSNWNKPQEFILEAARALPANTVSNISVVFEAASDSALHNKEQFLRIRHATRDRYTFSNTGDPHVRTFSNASYSLFDAKIFWSVKSKYLAIQSQQYKCRAGTQVGCNADVTIRFKSTFIYWTVDQRVNGTTQPKFEIIGPQDVVKVTKISNNFYAFLFSDNSEVRLASYLWSVGFHWYTNINAFVGCSYFNRVSGLCGGLTGNPSHDVPAKLIANSVVPDADDYRLCKGKCSTAPWTGEMAQICMPPAPSQSSSAIRSSSTIQLPKSSSTIPAYQISSSAKAAPTSVGPRTSTPAYVPPKVSSSAKAAPTSVGPRPSMPAYVPPKVSSSAKAAPTSAGPKSSTAAYVPPRSTTPAYIPPAKPSTPAYRPIASSSPAVAPTSAAVKSSSAAYAPPMPSTLVYAPLKSTSQALKPIETNSNAYLRPTSMAGSLTVRTSSSLAPTQTINSITSCAKLSLPTNLPDSKDTAYGQAKKICGEAIGSFRCGAIDVEFHLKGCILDATLSGSVDVVKSYLNDLMNMCDNHRIALKSSEDIEDRQRAKEIADTYGLKDTLPTLPSEYSTKTDSNQDASGPDYKPAIDIKRHQPDSEDEPAVTIDEGQDVQPESQDRGICKNGGKKGGYGGCKCPAGFTGFDCSVDIRECKTIEPTKDEIQAVTGLNGSSSDATSTTVSIIALLAAIAFFILQ